MDGSATLAAMIYYSVKISWNILGHFFFFFFKLETKPPFVRLHIPVILPGSTRPAATAVGLCHRPPGKQFSGNPSKDAMVPLICRFPVLMQLQWDPKSVCQKRLKTFADPTAGYFSLTQTFWGAFMRFAFLDFGFQSKDKAEQILEGEFLLFLLSQNPRLD